MEPNQSTAYFSFTTYIHDFKCALDCRQMTKLHHNGCAVAIYMFHLFCFQRIFIPGTCKRHAVAQKREYYGLSIATNWWCSVLHLTFGRVCVCVSFVSVDSFLGRQRAEKIKLQIRYVHMDCCRYGTRRLRATRETDKKEEKSASANPFGNTSSEVDEQKKKETKTNTPEVLEYEREISHG